MRSWRSVGANMGKEKWWSTLIQHTFNSSFVARISCSTAWVSGEFPKILFLMLLVKVLFFRHLNPRLKQSYNKTTVMGERGAFLLVSHFNCMSGNTRVKRYPHHISTAPPTINILGSLHTPFSIPILPASTPSQRLQQRPRFGTLFIVWRIPLFSSKSAMNSLDKVFRFMTFTTSRKSLELIEPLLEKKSFWTDADYYDGFLILLRQLAIKQAKTN